MVGVHLREACAACGVELSAGDVPVVIGVRGHQHGAAATTFRRRRLRRILRFSRAGGDHDEAGGDQKLVHSRTPSVRSRRNSRGIAGMFVRDLSARFRTQL